MKTKQDLVDKLIAEFVNDANNGDTTIIDELLMNFVGVQNLISCLSEDKWEEFNHLRNENKIRIYKNRSFISFEISENEKNKLIEQDLIFYSNESGQWRWNYDNDESLNEIEKILYK